MALLRTWLVVLTLVAGVAFAIAMVAPRGISEDLAHEVDARLERTEYASALLLRVNARKWIDTVGQVARDAVLVESLDQATRGPADLALVHKTVQDRLRSFNEQMKVDLVLATDAHGRVIARAGVDASVYKDSIDGYPLVGDALRGLRGDDSWAIGGKLYRVAASPVILRDRYVGTVVVGQEANTELAESIKTALGADVALLLRGRVIASTAALPILDRLPIAASAHADELARAGRSQPFAIEGYGVVFGSFVGEASEQQAMFALVVPRAATATFGELLLSLARRDPRSTPWRSLAPVGAGVLVALIIGLLLVSVYVARPIDRLVEDAHAVSRGERQRVPETSYAGALRTVAQAINGALEKIAARIRAEQRADAVPQRTDEGTVTTPRAPRPEPPAMLDPMPSLPSSAIPTEAKLASLREPPRPLHSLGAPTLVGGEEAEAPSSDENHWAEASNDPGRGLFTQSQTPLPPPMMGTDTAPVQVFSVPDEPLPVPRQERPTARELPIRTPTPAPRAAFEEKTSVESPSEALLIASANNTNDEVEADFRRVYDEFVTTRQTCGETLEGVTLEKFVAKLRSNRAELIKRYGCSSVRFQVYIREGRTALKATPNA